MRKFDFRAEKFDLHTPFVISRGTRTNSTVIVVEIEEGKYKGWGESCPTPHYGESVESVMAQIETIVAKMEAGLTREELQSALPRVPPAMQSIARCGI